VIRAILEHGDLSDIAALSAELQVGIRLRPPHRDHNLVFASADVTTGSPYIAIAGFQFYAVIHPQDKTTDITLSFVPKFPMDVCRWGKEWKRPFSGADTMVFDGPTQHDESVLWGENDGIEITTTNDVMGQSSEQAWFRQKIHRAVTYPESLFERRRAPGHLIEHLVDVFLSDELGDFARVGAMLHVGFSVGVNRSEAGFTGATLLEALEDAKSQNVTYEVNNSGFTHRLLGPCCIAQVAVPHGVNLSIPVDTDAVCLPADSFEEELKRRRVVYWADRRNASGLYDWNGETVARYFVIGENLMSATVGVIRSCIEEISIDQVTDVRHAAPYPLQFSLEDMTGSFIKRLGESGRDKVAALLAAAEGQSACGINLLLNDPLVESRREARAEHRLAGLVRAALTHGGVALNRVQLLEPSGLPTPPNVNRRTVALVQQAWQADCRR